MKRIHKILFPVMLFLIFVIFGGTVSFLTSRVNMLELYQSEILSPERYLLLSTVFSVLIMFASYFSCFRFFKKKKELVLVLFLISLVALIVPLFMETISIYMLLKFLALGVQFSFYGVVIYLLYDWYEKKQQAKILKRQNLQSELTLLKNQINPHFLFNTLNNIDSLIKSNPNKASHTLVELSGMMRYMIYDTNVDKAPLSKELEYIENYIEIQKLQYPNVNLVSYKIIGKPDNISVAPMMFIPFIENAFKHCTDKEKENAIRFSFDLRNDKKILFFAINIADATHSISKDESSGVGLEVVKRRLDLIYPKRHSLEIRKENDLFCVSLSIDV